MSKLAVKLKPWKKDPTVTEQKTTGIHREPEATEWPLRDRSESAP
jgi:hypothetical protein